MFVETHMVPVKKKDSNKGSCGGLAEYLSKESDALFFNHERSDIVTEKATEIIDKHSKGRLAKDESKWYSPMYALSQEECQHIVFRLFKKNYENYNDMSDSEQKQYNDYVIYLGRNFQDAMASNFDKESLGIKTGADLVYVGVVENDRYYKSGDKEVKTGRAEKGSPKPGFNTHIHIIQSRKANNAKNSKISPQSKYKERTKNNFKNDIKGGFDRGGFYSIIEKKFDEITKFNRSYLETFEYKNQSKKDKRNTNVPKERTSTIKKEIMKKKNFYTQDEQNEIFANSSLVDYFYSLADRGIIRFEKRRGEDHVFNDLEQKTGSIFVNDTKGFNYWGIAKGRILNAVKHFEGLGHKEALDYLIDKNGFNNYEFKNDAIYEQRNTKATKLNPARILSSGEITNPYILNYFLTRGISADVIKNNVQEIKYERNGKTYSSGGIANVAGGFNVRNQNFKGVVGGNNDVSVIEGNQNVLIFEGLVSYLSYLEMNKKIKSEETVVILNSVGNTKTLFNLLDIRAIQNVSACVDADSAGDAFMKELRTNFKGNINDLRSEYQLDENLDLNDRLVIDQIKNISIKL